MSKILILGLALSLVFASGAFVAAQADCGCLPHISLCNPCNWFSFCPNRDKDLGVYNPFPDSVHSIVGGCCGNGG